MTDHAAVPSPCNSVCRMDPITGWCEGCQRTLDEIASWSTFDDSAKLQVWDELAARRAAMTTSTTTEATPVTRAR